jgi:hypothetical protein
MLGKQQRISNGNSSPFTHLIASLQISNLNATSDLGRRIIDRTGSLMHYYGGGSTHSLLAVGYDATKHSKQFVDSHMTGKQVMMHIIRITCPNGTTWELHGTHMFTQGIRLFLPTGAQIWSLAVEVHNR